jgi:hypothetical protein
MHKPPDPTILEWIMRQVDELGGGGLRDLTAEQLESRIRESELTEAQQAVLLSRDPVRIRAVIEYELGYQLEAYSSPLYFVLPIHI